MLGAAGVFLCRFGIGDQHTNTLLNERGGPKPPPKLCACLFEKPNAPCQDFLPQSALPKQRIQRQIECQSDYRARGAELKLLPACMGLHGGRKKQPTTPGGWRVMFLGEGKGDRILSVSLSVSGTPSSSCGTRFGPPEVVFSL